MFYAKKQTVIDYKNRGYQLGNLYTVIDMATFNPFTRMERERGYQTGCFVHSVNLFENTPEEIYADLSPYLCLVESSSFNLNEDALNYLHKIEKTRNAVIWIWSGCSLIELQEHLQYFLNSKLRNGREVLFRFYDPRVMPAFFNILQEHQAERFWNKINRCMFWDARIEQYQLYERTKNEKE